MSIYVKNNNDFLQASPVLRECPHCGTHAQLLPTAMPSYDALIQAQPRHVGIGYRCAACSEPRFVRAAVRAYGPDQIELSSHLVEVERGKERFAFGHLPATVERLFREALDCYTADCHNAFASMCRRTIRASRNDVGTLGHGHVYDLFRDAVRISEIDEKTAQVLEAILFTTESEEPEVSASESAALIEIVKDMLHQCYVRTAKIKAAMKMRRFFAEESAQNVTPIGKHHRRAESA